MRFSFHYRTAEVPSPGTSRRRVHCGEDQFKGGEVGSIALNVARQTRQSGDGRMRADGAWCKMAVRAVAEACRVWRSPADPEDPDAVQEE